MIYIYNMIYIYIYYSQIHHLTHQSVNVRLRQATLDV